MAVVDKPAGWTSHDVVARCRKLLSTPAVGHSGTLDPDATGVLLLGVGRVTKLLRFLNDLPKTYVGEIVLGTATSTLDAAGEVTGTWDMSGVTAAAVATAALSLTGDIMQIPPMVSAVQIGGKRLYELARKGIEIEREPRPVTVHSFSTAPTDDPLVWRCEVTCSTGTYVRVIAADLGAALGGGGHLRNLRRTSIGGFVDAIALPLDEVAADRLFPAAAAVAHLATLRPSPVVIGAVRHGQVLEPDVLGVTAGDQGPWRVLDADGGLIAVYERVVAGLKPAVVLSPG